MGHSTAHTPEWNMLMGIWVTEEVLLVHQARTWLNKVLKVIPLTSFEVGSVSCFQEHCSKHLGLCEAPPTGPHLMMTTRTAFRVTPAIPNNVISGPSIYGKVPSAI